MKKLFLTALVLSTMIFATNVSALPGVSLDAGIALPMPTGDFGDAAKAGYGIGADAFFGIPMIPLKVGGHVAYNKLDTKKGSDDFSIIEIVPSLRYSIISAVIADLYAQAGIGYYYVDSSVKGVDAESKMGINFGVGVSAKILPTVGFFAMPLYNIVFTEDKNTSYVSLNIGVNF